MVAAEGPAWHHAAVTACGAVPCAVEWLARAGVPVEAKAEAARYNQQQWQPAIKATDAKVPQWQTQDRSPGSCAHPCRYRHRRTRTKLKYNSTAAVVLQR
eukprot:4462524-Pyramimonas_sp.AAC.1